MIKHNRPISDFNWLCQLDEKKGLSVGKTYRNLAAARTCLSSIAEVEFCKISNIIKEARYICAIGDGSTDASVKEQEMWYMITCISGNIDVLFIGVKTVERANAENIVDGKKYILNTNLHIEYTDVVHKFVALSCDGASVTGTKSGVGAILRNDQTCILTVHCLAHRFELSLNDSVKSVKLYEKTM